MMQFLKPLILREAEDGTGGGESTDPYAAIEARNKALEARLAQQQQQLDNFTRTTQEKQQQQERQQIESRVQQAVDDAAAAVDIAERELAAAHEDGDPSAIARAQRKIAETAAKRERVEAEAANVRNELKQQSERRTQGSRGAEDLDTSNLDNWKDRNKEWYGIDQEMTRAAHEIDGSVRAAGTFKVGSQEYFQAIDRAMKQRFPDRYAGAPASVAARGDGANNGQRPPRRYTESIQRGMEAFGMSAEQWDAARSKAVQKGLLSEIPDNGRIRA